MVNEPKDTTDKVCPKCKKPQDEWKDSGGHEKNGTTYCCKGCAKGKGCKCE